MARTRASLELALAESIHRARNDLQAVSAMLHLQAVSTDNPHVRDALQSAGDRVDALALLNARLNGEAEGGATTIDMCTLLEGLAGNIRAMHLRDRSVELTLQVEPHAVGIDKARALGLILNELVVNSLKYAFPRERAGVIAVAFRCQDGDCEMTVADDGIGFDPAAPPQGSGLGRVMISALAGQVEAEVDIAPRPGGGTICIIRWCAQA